MKKLAMIGVCPVCNQGRLVIAREKATGLSYVACEDCESEWANPTVCRDVRSATRDHFGQSEYLSVEEAEGHPWRQFIQ